MTREEKERLFDGLCDLNDGLCDRCPKEVEALCDKKNTENFTNDELDMALASIGRRIAKLGEALPLEGVQENPDKETEEIFADFDVVERPAHYTETSIECIDAMRETQGDEAVKAFCVCNAFKYLWRHNRKNGDEDIKKASWYLNKAVEIMEGEKKC